MRVSCPLTRSVFPLFSSLCAGCLNWRLYGSSVGPVFLPLHQPPVPPLPHLYPLFHLPLFQFAVLIQLSLCRCFISASCLVQLCLLFLAVNAGTACPCFLDMIPYFYHVFGCDTRIIPCCFGPGTMRMLCFWTCGKVFVHSNMWTLSAICNMQYCHCSFL